MRNFSGVQLGERHVGGGRERRERCDEPEVAIGRAQLQRHREAEHVGLLGQWRKVGLELGEKRLQRRVGALRQLSPQVLGDVPAPLRQVAHPGRIPIGVQGQAEHVDRWCEQRGVDAFVEHLERPVGDDEDAVRPHDHRRVREMTVENRLQRLLNWAERLVVER